MDRNWKEKTEKHRIKRNKRKFEKWKWKEKQKKKLEPREQEWINIKKD